jgi:hypothetical protein
MLYFWTSRVHRNLVYLTPEGPGTRAFEANILPPVLDDTPDHHLSVYEVVF